MASAAHPAPAHGTHDDHEYHVVKHQFEDLEQQNDSYIVGMWTFLVTEVMFFGALFLIYTLYRINYLHDWYKSHEHLSIPLGGLNTVNLLISSLLMALAVRAAMLKNRKAVLGLLAAVQACAGGFLVIKAIEYTGKFNDNLYPGASFTQDPSVLHGANLNHAQMFYGLYFGMTGLHGVHVLVGMLLIGVLMFKWYRKHPIVTEDYIPTELIGLYWHFVDIVWIFLFPLFYLMPNPDGHVPGGHGGGH
jgi:cytochrome c oxidase subunit III